VTSVGDGSFSGCLNLTNITVDLDNPYYKADDDVLIYAYYGVSLVVYPCGLGNTYTVPNYVGEIGESAFSGCSYLTSVNTSYVDEIDYGAFSDSQLDFSGPWSLYG